MGHRKLDHWRFGHWKIITLSAALAIGAVLSANSPASALPLTPSTGGNDLRASVDATSPLIEVRRWRRGWGVGAGFATGVIVGGAIASPYYYRPYPYYYAPPPYVYGPPPYAAGDSATAYCMQRFRSYDPYSGTFLGYDGLRHPCP